MLIPNTRERAVLNLLRVRNTERKREGKKLSGKWGRDHMVGIMRVGIAKGMNWEIIKKGIGFSTEKEKIKNMDFEERFVSPLYFFFQLYLHCFLLLYFSLETS